MAQSLPSGPPLHLVWHRADLRLHDNPALEAALHHGAVVGVALLDPHILAQTSPRRQAWFCENLRALRQAYERRGGFLLVRQGVPWEVLPHLVDQLRVERVFAVRNTTPYARHRDEKVEQALPGRVVWCPGQYVHEPGTVFTASGGPHRVFTPYARAWWALPKPLPLDPPARFPAVQLPRHLTLGEIPHIESGIPLPPAGEEAALDQLARFLREKLAHYHAKRNLLSGEGGSRLSPYFTLGVLSPRLAAAQALQHPGPGARSWVNELCWRDFSGHLLYHFPRLLHTPFDCRFASLPWQDEGELFAAWLAGQTGIPVVDAAMRELNATGFVSNRARMVVAQYAVKYCLLPWQKCERAFRQLLLDGDNAANILGWQWSGGLGVDAVPYFRIFNLVTQGSAWDPQGLWLRRWVPESQGQPHPYKKLPQELPAARQRYLTLAAQRVKKPPSP